MILWPVCRSIQLSKLVSVDLDAEPCSEEPLGILKGSNLTQLDDASHLIERHSRQWWLLWKRQLRRLELLDRAQLRSEVDRVEVSARDRQTENHLLRLRAGIDRGVAQVEHVVVWPERASETLVRIDELPQAFEYPYT